MPRLNDRIAANKFNEGRRHVVQCYVPKSFAVLLKKHGTKLGIADPCRIFQHLLKHRFKLTGRTRR